MTPKNSYPLAPEKEVIKSEQMPGYQERLVADLNLDPPNSKTLVLTPHMALREGSQKRTKPLSGMLGGHSCLGPARTFPAAVNVLLNTAIEFNRKWE